MLRSFSYLKVFHRKFFHNCARWPDSVQSSKESCLLYNDIFSGHKPAHCGAHWARPLVREMTQQLVREFVITDLHSSLITCMHAYEGRCYWWPSRLLLRYHVPHSFIGSLVQGPPIRIQPLPPPPMGGIMITLCFMHTFMASCTHFASEAQTRSCAECP